MNTKVTYRVITPDGEVFTHTEIEAQWYGREMGYPYQVVINGNVIYNYECKDLRPNKSLEECH